MTMCKEHTLFDGHIKISTDDGFETSRISQNLTGGTAFVVNPESDESIIIEFLNYWQNCNIIELIKFHFKILSNNCEALDSSIEEICQISSDELEIPKGFDSCYILLGLHESNPYGKKNYRYSGISLGFLFSIKYKLIIMVAKYKPFLEKTKIDIEPMLETMKTFKLIDFEIYINYNESNSNIANDDKGLEKKKNNIINSDEISIDKNNLDEISIDNNSINNNDTIINNESENILKSK